MHIRWNLELRIWLVSKGEISAASVMFFSPDLRGSACKTDPIFNEHINDHILQILCLGISVQHF